MKKRVLIKISGKVQNEPKEMDILITEIKKISKFFDVIFMHGGGIQITEYYEKIGLKSMFIEGLRKTDNEQIKIVEMVLSGLVNKDIVSKMVRKNIKAIGISGRDNLITAREKFVNGKSLGNVGEAIFVNKEIIEDLFRLDFIPVISPVSNSVDYLSLNVNADDAAELVASTLKVDYLLLLSDVDGVWDENKNIIDVIDERRANSLIDNGVIIDGMAVKVKSSFNAINKGVKNISINSVKKGVLTDLLLDDKISGTVLRK